MLQGTQQMTKKTKKQKDDFYDRLGTVIQLVTAGKSEEALEAAGELLKDHPEQSECYFALGMIAYQQGDLGRAIELFNSAHAMDPDYREYADALAVLYTSKGMLSDGLYYAKLATALEPAPKPFPLLPEQLSDYFQSLAQTRPSTHHVNAMALFNARDFKAAAEECESELRFNKSHEDVCRLLAKASIELGNYERAEGAIKAAVALNPDFSENFSVLGDTLFHLGEFSDGIEAHHVALSRDSESLAPATAAFYDSRFLGDDLIPVQKEFEEEIVRRLENLPQDHDPSLTQGAQNKDRKIRVGYISNSLFDSDLGIRTQTLLSFHDRSKFDVYIYQVSIAQDTVNVNVTVHATSAREIYELDDDIVSMIIGNDQIDVLVDLCGYSPDNRLGIIANNPAPVVMGLLQYPYGFGVPGVNFVLSDPVTAETDSKALGEWQENLILDFGLVAVSPYSAMQDVRALPAKKNDFVTFGGTCDLAYLLPPVVDTWAKILKAVPDSRLLLGNVLMVPGTVRARVNDLFEAHGVADRIDYHDSGGTQPGRQDFYHQIDILLDTFPVSGEVSLCEAMWMGVPVLSRKGDRRTSQMGASILFGVGKPEWVSSSGKEMVNTAKALAGDLKALVEIRSTLRDKVAEGALFNPRVLMTSIEKAYVDALQRERSKKS